MACFVVVYVVDVVVVVFVGVFPLLLLAVDSSFVEFCPLFCFT